MEEIMPNIPIQPVTPPGPQPIPASAPEPQRPVPEKPVLTPLKGRKHKNLLELIYG
jgi:hypothetical protein